MTPDTAEREHQQRRDRHEERQRPRQAAATDPAYGCVDWFIYRVRRRRDVSGKRGNDD